MTLWFWVSKDGADTPQLVPVWTAAVPSLERFQIKPEKAWLWWGSALWGSFPLDRDVLCRRRSVVPQFGRSPCAPGAVGCWAGLTHRQPGTSWCCCGRGCCTRATARLREHRQCSQHEPRTGVVSGVVNRISKYLLFLVSCFVGSAGGFWVFFSSTAKIPPSAYLPVHFFSLYAEYPWWRFSFYKKTLST